MAMRSKSLLFAVAAICLWSCSACYELQHSLDGGRAFVTAGSIERTGQEDYLELTRKAASSSEQQALQKLVEDDGFYVVRVQTARPGQYVTASIRAACLAMGAEGDAENLQLHVNEDGSVSSLAYALEGMAGGACMATHEPQLPSKATVLLKKPVEGPTVLTPTQAAQADLASAGIFSGAGDAGYQGSGSSGSASGGPTARPRGQLPDQAAAGAEGGEPPAPVKEKTWFEKNWLMTIGISMAVMNIFGNIMKQGQQPQPGAARPAAAAGRS